MRKLSTLLLAAATVATLTPTLAGAQDWRDRRDEREDVRDARRELRQDYRDATRDGYVDRGERRELRDGRRDLRDERRDLRDARRDYRDDGRGWNSDWRRDRRYDWQGYRSANRGLYGGRYYAPRGQQYGYRQFGVGARLPNYYYGRNYWINDPYRYRLPPTYGNYRWVRYYNDVLLVDIVSGLIRDSVRGFYY